MSHLRGIPTLLRERFGVPVVFYDGDVPMSLPEFGGIDTGFNYYFGADPSEYDLVLSNSEGGLDRLRELGARRAEAVFWGADPELFRPLPVEKETDVFFYGYGDKFRQEWTEAMIGEPSRRLPGRRLLARRAGLPRRHRPRAALGDVPFNVFSRAISAARINLNVTRRAHASVYASSTSRRSNSRCPARRSSPIRTRGSNAGSSRAASCSSSRTPTRRRRLPRLLDDPAAGGGAGPRRPRARARRAHLPSPRATRARPARTGRAGGRPWLRSATETRVPTRAAAGGQADRDRPCLQRGGERPGVIDEIRAFDPDFEVVVVDDGSIDGTAAAATARGAHVVRLPFNLGIGGAVQTGFRYAFEHGFQLAVRVDGDGQHDPAQLGALLGPMLADEADIVVGSRFASDGGYRSSRSRRLGIRILAKTLSMIVASPGHRPDLRLPGAEPAQRSRSSPPTIRTTTPRSRRR